MSESDTSTVDYTQHDSSRPSLTFPVAIDCSRPLPLISSRPSSPEPTGEAEESRATPASPQSVWTPRRTGLSELFKPYTNKDAARVGTSGGPEASPPCSKRSRSVSPPTPAQQHQRRYQSDSPPPLTPSQPEIIEPERVVPYQHLPSYNTLHGDLLQLYALQDRITLRTRTLPDIINTFARQHAIKDHYSNTYTPLHLPSSPTPHHSTPRTRHSRRTTHTITSQHFSRSPSSSSPESPPTRRTLPTYNTLHRIAPPLMYQDTSLAPLASPSPPRRVPTRHTTETTTIAHPSSSGSHRSTTATTRPRHPFPLTPRYPMISVATQTDPPTPPVPPVPPERRQRYHGITLFPRKK